MFTLSACAVPQASPTATPTLNRISAPTATAAVTPTPSPTAAPTPAAISTPTPTGAQAELVIKGAAVFFATAGGAGCAYCHMPDARGFHTMPNIREVEEKRIRFALNGGVQAMNFIELTEEEIVAVTAYLATLTEP